MTALLLVARGAMGAFRAVWAWLSENPWRWSLVAIAFLSWQWQSAHGGKIEAQRQVIVEQDAHKVSLASIATLMHELDRKKAEANARAEAFEQARQTGAVAARRNAEAYRPTARRIDAVRASMGQNGERCETPANVRELLR